MLLKVFALLVTGGHAAPTNTLPVGAPTDPLNQINSPRFVPLLVQAPNAAEGTFVPVVVPKPKLDEQNGSPIPPAGIENNASDSAVGVASNNQHDTKSIGSSTLERMIVKSVEKAVEEIVAADLMVVASAIRNDTEAESLIADALKDTNNGNETVLTQVVQSAGQNSSDNIILSVKSINNSIEVIPINSTMAEQIMKALDVKKITESKILKKIIEIETVKNIESDIMSTISNKSESEIISIGNSLAETDTNVNRTISKDFLETAPTSFPMSMVIAMVIKAATEQLVKQMEGLNNSTITSSPEESFALTDISSISTNNSEKEIKEHEMPGTIFVIINDEPSLNTTISAATLNLLNNRSNISASTFSSSVSSSTQNSTSNKLFHTESIGGDSNSNNKTETINFLKDNMNETGSNQSSKVLESNLVASSPVSTGEIELDSTFSKDKIIITSLTQTDLNLASTVQKEKDNYTSVLKIIAEPFLPLNVSTNTKVADIDNSAILHEKDNMKIQALETNIEDEIEVKGIGKQLNIKDVKQKQTPLQSKQTSAPATENLIVNKNGGIVFGTSNFGSSVSPTNFIIGKPVQIPMVAFNSGPPVPIPANSNPQLLVEPRFRKFIFPNDSPDVVAAKVSFFQVRAASPGGAANSIK